MFFKILKIPGGTFFFPRDGVLLAQGNAARQYVPPFLMLSAKGIVNSMLCPRTVFSQTQEIKNVCLKRRFQFVGRKNYKLKTPTLLPGKS